MSAPTFLQVNTLIKHWRHLTVASIVGATIGYGSSHLVTPMYTAKASFIPPQGSQTSSAANALSSLGNFSSLLGAGSMIKSPADQIVSILQSARASNSIIKQFNLTQVYDCKLLEDTRAKLASNVLITANKKDGIIRIEATDSNPERSAQIANAYIEEITRILSQLTISEAKQRRVFFEGLLSKTKQSLIESQAALEASGVNQGILNIEPKLTTERYARLKSEQVNTQVRMETLKKTHKDSAAEVRSVQAVLDALNNQLATLERGHEQSNKSEYIQRYRNFKYQEALFEIYSKQFEIARLDESKESTSIQVIDEASRPEKRTRPRRAYFAMAGAISLPLIALIWIASRQKRQSVALQ